VLGGRAAAQAYPTRPVRVLLGFPPGGTADILTRMICEWLQARLGQPFVVENRPGAATNLATEAVVRAPADGHTLLATTTSNLLNGAMFDDLRYDFARDIAPIASLTTQPLVLLAASASPVRTLSAFIAHARAHPGASTVGNFGNGTLSHLAAELLKQMLGIDVLSVPFRGSPPMLAELLAGRIDAAFDNLPAAIEHIRAGRLHALAVTGAERSAVMPDVPMVSDVVPGYEALAVAGMGAPRGTPLEILATLNVAINAGLADPPLRARLADLGATIRAGTPTDFAQLIARETEKWTRVIRTSGIRMN
jgi:tripartite-type tricarboxylate transporter receptor subunit TctC